MIAVSELKKHLRLEHTTADDAYLADLEAAAVAYAERETGRNFGLPRARTQHVAGTGTNTLWLPDAPILSDPIAADDMTVVGRGDVGDAGDNVAISSGFVVRGNRLIRVGGVWARGYEYEVTYTAGVAPGMAPENVQHAIRMLVAHWYVSRTPVSIGTISPDISFAVKELLGGNPVLA